MDKQKIIKLVASGVVLIGAIIYYFINYSNSDAYDNVLEENLVVKNNNVLNSVNNIKETNKIKVYVTGEVNSPGVIELEEGDRIDSAIEKAGGITKNADLNDINLAYQVDDGEKIYIPNLDETKEKEELESEKIPVQESKDSSKTSLPNASTTKVNINKATSDELLNIPGIGKSTAEKIVVYRDENGKFKSIEDIKKVSGIGNSKYEKIKDYITVK